MMLKLFPVMLLLVTAKFNTQGQLQFGGKCAYVSSGASNRMSRSGQPREFSRVSLKPCRTTPGFIFTKQGNLIKVGDKCLYYIRSKKKLFASSLVCSPSTRNEWIEDGDYIRPKYYTKQCLYAAPNNKRVFKGDCEVEGAPVEIDQQNSVLPTFNDIISGISVSSTELFSSYLIVAVFQVTGSGDNNVDRNIFQIGDGENTKFPAVSFTGGSDYNLNLEVSNCNEQTEMVAENVSTNIGPGINTVMINHSGQGNYVLTVNGVNIFEASGSNFCDDGRTVQVMASNSFMEAADGKMFSLLYKEM